MTKYKLLKPIKNVEWKVEEVRETEEDWNGFDDIITRSCRLRHFDLLFLEHAGFIEEVDETPKRWRAEEGGMYYFLDETFEEEPDEDHRCSYDNARYEAGNYFQTTEQIEEFQKGVKALVGIK